MKNPQRIKGIINKLESAWRLVPDWRLCQLISNLHGNGQQDIFYTEEDELEQGLDAFIKEYSNTKS